MSQPLISLRNVEKSYPFAGGRTWVLRRIHLDVQPEMADGWIQAP